MYQIFELLTIGEFHTNCNNPNKLKTVLISIKEEHGLMPSYDLNMIHIEENQNLNL